MLVPLLIKINSKYYLFNNSKWRHRRSKCIIYGIAGIHVGCWSKWVKPRSWWNIERVLIPPGFLVMREVGKVIWTHEVSTLGPVVVPAEWVLILATEAIEVRRGVMGVPGHVP
jgi:hypothetical protein